MIDLSRADQPKNISFLLNEKRFGTFLTYKKNILLTKKGWNLNSLSSLKEFVMPTHSKNMSCVVVSLKSSISSLTDQYKMNQ